MSRDIALSGSGLFPSTPEAQLDLAGGTVQTPERRGRLDHPSLVLAAGAVATAVVVAIDALITHGSSQPNTSLIVLTSSGSGVAAMLLMARRGEGRILVYRPLAMALALAGMGVATLDLTPAFGREATWLVANVLFAIAGCIAMAVLAPAFYRRLDRRAAASAVLDGGIMLVAGTTVLVTMWRTGSGAPSGVDGYLMPVMAAGLFASAGMAAVAAFSMRAAPALRGIWAGLLGVLILGHAWILWVDRMLQGLDRDSLANISFTAGILVVSYAWVTWNDDTGGGKLYRTIASSLADWLPVAAILACVTVSAIPHGRIGDLDPAPAGTAAVILLAIIRQRLLVASERWISRRLASEMQERAQAMLSLARLEQADTLEDTAESICLEAMRLESIDSACVYAFGPSGAVVPLAVRGASQPEETAGQPISPRRAQHIRALAVEGTWIDVHDDSVPDGSAVAEAFAPMRWDDRVVGVVGVGTTRPEDAERLRDRLSTLTEFGVVSSALMGPALEEEWRVADVRALLTQVIDNHAFRPVFQPIVVLRNSEIVGYEALTRFADGTRPDKRFLEAHMAGMSVRLEMACVVDQLEAATWLPEGTWVSLNVSPALASAVVPLVASLERADREVVLEITEHVEIGDYQKLVSALELIRGRARLAVDDAGAGYAGLRHILELRPHFVKLDVSLVRNVDTDPARQAMVAGMAHFARNSGCELIAEGIETEGERAELVRLGVGLGQGYLFGKPTPVA
jgi:EAL domain-containing protein (putative c-di-GMP-specific phosphodiesterase class I)